MQEVAVRAKVHTDKACSLGEEDNIVRKGTYAAYPSRTVTSLVLLAALPVPSPVEKRPPARLCTLLVLKKSGEEAGSEMVGGRSGLISSDPHASHTNVIGQVFI